MLSIELKSKENGEVLVSSHWHRGSKMPTWAVDHDTWKTLVEMTNPEIMVDGDEVGSMFPHLGLTHCARQVQVKGVGAWMLIAAWLKAERDPLAIAEAHRIYAEESRPAIIDFAERVGAFFEANDPDAGLGISMLIQAFASGERTLP